MPLVQGTGYRVIRSSDDSKVIQTLNVQPKWKLFVKWLSLFESVSPLESQVKLNIIFVAAVFRTLLGESISNHLNLH